jgi:hypothetical protein
METLKINDKTYLLKTTKNLCRVRGETYYTITLKTNKKDPLAFITFFRNTHKEVGALFDSLKADSINTIYKEITSKYHPMKLSYYSDFLKDNNLVVIK